jgi:YHS domain-containing protein
MRELDIGVPDPVNPSRPAALDSTLRVRIGHDFFLFSGADQRRRFIKDPLRYVRALTDPVTLSRFAVSRRSPRLTYHGRTYYFAADSTRARFVAHPDSFAVRKGM